MSTAAPPPRRPLPNVVELTCREVIGAVGDYLDAELAPDERARLEQHLFICPPCTTYLDQYRETVEATHQLAHAGNAVEPAPAPSPESFRGEVRDTVRTLLERRRAQGGTPGGHR